METYITPDGGIVYRGQTRKARVHGHRPDNHDIFEE